MKMSMPTNYSKFV